MKSWITWLTATLLIVLSSINLQAQPQDTTNILVPEWIATRVIDELIVKDGLVYELGKKDSILTVYERMLEQDQKVIALYKLNGDEYKAIIENKDLIIESKTKETKQLKRQVVGLKILGVFEALILIVVVLAATVL